MSVQPGPDSMQGEGDLPLPQAFVDAGSVPWPELHPVLDRLLAALGPGQVLEVVTSHPDTPAALLAWSLTWGLTFRARPSIHGGISLRVGRAVRPEPA